MGNNEFFNFFVYEDNDEISHLFRCDKKGEIDSPYPICGNKDIKKESENLGYLLSDHAIERINEKFKIPFPFSRKNVAYLSYFLQFEEEEEEICVECLASLYQKNN